MAEAMTGPGYFYAAINESQLPNVYTSLRAGTQSA